MANRYRVYWRSFDSGVTVLADHRQDAIAHARRIAPREFEDGVEPIVRYLSSITGGTDAVKQQAAIEAGKRRKDVRYA